jgi:cobalt-zinc-cadmium efflux system outer membrane protein
MISRIVLASALFGTLAAGGPAGAEQAPSATPSMAAPADDETLAALVEEALAKNPDLRVAAEAVRAARQRPAQASALADPVLGVSYTNEGWSPTLGEMPDANLAVMLSQDLPFPGKRRLRGRIASRQADEVEQQLVRARLSLAASVRRAYYGLLQARSIADLIREQALLWRQIEGVARARYSVGQGNQQDVLRTQVELTRVGQVLAEQDAEAAIRLAEINRLLDRPADMPLETPATLDASSAASAQPTSLSGAAVQPTSLSGAAAQPTSLSGAAVQPTSLSGAAAQPISLSGAAVLAGELERLRAFSPELTAARIAIDRARLLVELARKEYRPDFSVQGGYMNRGRLDPMWRAGVSVNLPLNRKRRASAVAELEAVVAATESQAAAVDLQLRLRTQGRLAQLEAAQKIATLYREGIVPQDRMSVEAAVASYQAGRLPFVAVLEALTTLYGDRATLVRALASQSRIRASLDEASLETTSDLPAMAPAALAAAPGAGAMTTGGTPGGAMGSMSR